MSAVDRAQPSFERWGLELHARPGRRTALPGVSTRLSGWRPLALIAVVFALAGALAAHFGGASPFAVGGGADRAVATAINLRASDLPGFAVSSAAGVTVGGDPATQFKQCFGSLPGTGANDGGPAFASRDFVSDNGLAALSIGSAVSFPSASARTADAAVARDPRFPQCVAQAFAALSYSAHGIQLNGADPSATTLPVPVSAGGAVDPILGMRAAITWNADGIEIPTYLDLYVIDVGHDEITLFAFSSERPPPIATEQRLVTALVDRAATQPH